MDTNVAPITVSFAVPVFPVAGSAAVTVTGPPTFNAVANPLKCSALMTFATVSSDEVQVTDDVISCVVKSEYVPVARNCCSVSSTRSALSGVTSMDTNVAAVTVSVAVPDLPVPISVAVIVVMPTADETANPLEPAALLTVATEISEDVHVTDDVRSCVVRSEYVPVAVNGCFVPRAILRLTGVTATDTNFAAVTVSFAVPVFPVAGSEAVIAVMPAAEEAANPLETAALLTVATISSEDFHVTDDVRSCVVRSEYVPVALNC